MHPPGIYLSICILGFLSFFSLFLVVRFTKLRSSKLKNGGKEKNPNRASCHPGFLILRCRVFSSSPSFWWLSSSKARRGYQNTWRRIWSDFLPEPKHCHSFSCHLTALKTPSTTCNHSDTLLHTNSLHSLLFSSPYDRYSCTLTSEQHTA